MLDFVPLAGARRKVAHRNPQTGLIVNLIAATTTVKGLKVHAEVDDGVYPAGTKIDDKELAGVRLRRDKFHGDWNYEIHPHPA